jgi:hypothetical protein
MAHTEHYEARAMDLEDLAKRLAESEIPYLTYESFTLAPDAVLLAKALIVIYEAVHDGEEDLRDHIMRVLDLTR